MPQNHPHTPKTGKTAIFCVFFSILKNSRKSAPHAPPPTLKCILYSLSVYIIKKVGGAQWGAMGRKWGAWGAVGRTFWPPETPFFTHRYFFFIYDSSNT